MGLHVPNFWAFWSIYLHLITLLLLINHFHPTTLVKALGNETDRFALLKFKEAIAIDPHGFLNSWNDSFHLCSWKGITCGTRHQRVTDLDMNSYDLHGTISPYIGNLSFLRSIDLQNNSFSGKIPQQLDHLFRLRYLLLYMNLLEGGIPVNLSFCPELSLLSFGANRLIGKIPSELGSLTKLVTLVLEINNLTGGIPPSLGNLSSLTGLGLAGNNLVGNIPEEICRLRSLSIIAISVNQLSGDFGLARLISTTTDSSQNQSSTIGIKGTIGYAAPEYAVGVEPSRQGDVYSYGILVLQMFTGRRPTDEMFKDGFNLHNFVKMAIPGRLMQIVDPTLLATLEETTPATTENKVNNINEIEADEENMDYEHLSKTNSYVWKCILPVLKIGLACSEESPRNRMSMEAVHRDLHHIQNAYIGVENCRERPRRS